MSEQENKELITKGYAAFSAGDVETVMSLFDDDVEWVQPGESAVSGTYHGKAGEAAALDAFPNGAPERSTRVRLCVVSGRQAAWPVWLHFWWLLHSA